MGKGPSVRSHGIGWWCWIISFCLLVALVILQLVWIITLSQQERSHSMDVGRQLIWHIDTETLTGNPLSLKHASSAQPSAPPPSEPDAQQPPIEQPPLALEQSGESYDDTTPEIATEQAPTPSAEQEPRVETPLPSWLQHATPVTINPTKHPIAVIITGLGLSRSATLAAMQLPGIVSLAFSPYAHDIRSWAEQATAKGADIYLELPMEPLDFPLTDPGPKALLTSLSQTQLRDRLHWVLDRYPNAVGVMGAIEEKFTDDVESASVLMQHLISEQKLFYSMHDSSKPLLDKTLASHDMLVLDPPILMDKTISDRAMDVALMQAIEKSKTDGYAIIVARPYPVSIRQLQRWSRTIERHNVQLVPLSSIALHAWRKQRGFDTP